MTSWDAKSINFQNFHRNISSNEPENMPRLPLAKFESEVKNIFFEISTAFENEAEFPETFAINQRLSPPGKYFGYSEFHWFLIHCGQLVRINTGANTCCSYSMDTINNNNRGIRTCKLFLAAIISYLIRN